MCGRQKIFVFQMNDCDWMAAATPESAIAGYEEYKSPDDDFVKEPPTELSDETMARLKFTGEPGEPDAGTRTFREELDRRIAAGETFPQFFASTEY